MIRLLLKDKMFLLGTAFLIGLVTLSFINSIFFDREVPQTLIEFNKDASVKSVPPYPPSFRYPFGTNTDGYSMLGLVIQGSKFTIGIGLVIVIIRILLSFLLSAVLSTYLSKLIPFIKWIAEPFSIIPQTLFAYFFC
ncbi:hypothetical protein [Bacillus sp. CECT 9360]|uniref:hypothetical protein n=1 Tax=Bacillus sp. CECT 9360 TaxID=2845821 RepID=UPI001E2D2960|nr:hypothetical protein [Bacillus sp. CECT 9360]CAH0347471.1 hypothetical protein BCI9360_03871 [Bacillus sp. CECT 9360]